MEDDLQKQNKKMEDNQPKKNGRRPKKKVEDNLKKKWKQIVLLSWIAIFLDCFAIQDSKNGR